MSRYIDAETLKETHYNFATGELVPLAWADIENAPHIDIVRCKECKHKDEIVNYCYKNDRNVNADDFCSYGERKE